MPKVCAATVCSADNFMYYIPLFAFSIGLAYPDWDVKIFLKGQLKDEIRALVPANTKIYEEMFLDYPDRVSTCNSLRFLIPSKYFEGYDYVYNTDVDFLIFPHKVTHLRYYSKIIDATGQPYAGARGPIRKPRRAEALDGWKGKMKRVAGGEVMLKTPDSLNQMTLSDFG